MIIHCYYILKEMYIMFLVQGPEFRFFKPPVKARIVLPEWREATAFRSSCREVCGIRIRLKIFLPILTVETPFNEPLYKEVLGIVNYILLPVIVKWMKKNLDIEKPLYRAEHILLAPSAFPFAISRFHCCEDTATKDTAA